MRRHDEIAESIITMQGLNFALASVIKDADALREARHDLKEAIRLALAAEFSRGAWRPDLPYPESHSDMQGAVRGLLRMFKVERRPIAIDLEYAPPPPVD